MLSKGVQLGLATVILWLHFYPFHAVIFVCGAVFAIVACFIVSISVPSAQFNNRPNPKRKFRFLSYPEWERRTESLKANFHDDCPTIVDSKKLSASISELLDIIINEFINSWFSQISSSPLFAQDVKVELSHVSKCIARKLQKIDYAKLVTFKLLPLFNNHYLTYASAHTNMDGTAEILARFNNGNLHVGVTLEQSEKKEKNIQEKTYLRGQIKKLLTKTFSDGEKSNDIVLMFVTEVLACTILDNVFNLLTDPDFLNLQFIKFIGDSLKRRNQVKELRSALEEHTMSSISADNNVADRTIHEIESSLQDIFIQDDTKERTVIQLDNEKKQSAKSDRLVALLKSPVESTAFEQYLKWKNKLYLLTFWRKVEQSTAPLMDDVQMPTSLSLTKEECIDIREEYFSSGLISIDDTNLENFGRLDANESFQHPSCFQVCKDALITLHEKVFQDLFSEYYFNFLLTEVDSYEGKKDVGENEAIVHQIEDKFATIMSDPKYDVAKGYSDGFQGKSPATGINERSMLSRNDRYSRLFEDDEPSSEDDDESDELDTDSDSIIMKEGSESMELAGPGNLHLAEKIPQIEKEIENLKRQLIYLEPLLQKAQLTNNQSKLKVLLKSKTGVQKDIAFKELQKQQYIVQESDNSLFGKSKVSILSVVHENEKGKQFVMYIIEVQKFSTEEPNVVKAGWVVARRYSQFHRLHGYLKHRYPQVSSLNFPQKSISVLKFQQKNITESRRHQLEAYLGALIEIPEVCSDMAFRSFLSSENFQLGKRQSFDEPKKLSALFGYKWYLGSPSNRNMVYNQCSSTPSDANGGILENRREMEKELRQFDERSTGKPLFIKPICDMIITIFNLHWLKGRALVVILQQFFGTAVENKVYEVVETHLNEPSICNWLIVLRELLFPNGRFKLDPEVRTKQQKLQAYQEAKQFFETFMTETWSKIFGSENTINAAITLFHMLQVNQLNKHLMFQIFDEILDELCSE
ncbi:Mdm1 protein [Candida orthopsilosis Co 90-125]|uniref:Mdm1 protein n=1 Tax=Candida orthopsilosis (strain 90-125) TaxID=1136231 RepID=H8WW43_CANO9|nr:Mdm1 protein [Candida orthopsilosis Co 90-125]CCG20667.1 Mdm1 protein [Candida orthopsilosis Co 90-125]